MIRPKMENGKNPMRSRKILYRLLKTKFLATAALLMGALQVSGADSTNLFSQLHYSQIDFRVLDAIMRRPLAGALVSPYCLGGTPYATNKYTTDTKGLVKPMFIRGMIAVRVSKDGYETSIVALAQTNPMVSMKRTQR